MCRVCWGGKAGRRWRLGVLARRAGPAAPQSGARGQQVSADLSVD